jgi:hypothetical protein
MKGTISVKNGKKASIRKKRNPCGYWRLCGDSTFNRMIRRTRCRNKFIKYPKKELQIEIELSL